MVEPFTCFMAQGALEPEKPNIKLRSDFVLPTVSKAWNFLCFYCILHDSCVTENAKITWAILSSKEVKVDLPSQQVDFVRLSSWEVVKGGDGWREQIQ